LPLPGFIGRHMWEIGGALAGLVAAPLIALMPVFGLRLNVFLRDGWLMPLVVLGAAIMGAGGGFFWGYRMQRGKGRLYGDWNRWW